MSDTAETAESRGITRRELIVGAAAGGVGLACGGVGLAAKIAEYEIEVRKLRLLLALYEQLEKVGIDAVIGTGMNIVKGGLDTLRNGVRLVRDGVTLAENALKALQGMLDNLRRGVEGVTGILGDIQSRLGAAEQLVGAVVGRAGSLAESVGGFFSSLLGKIPVVGDDLRRATDALANLIRGIPNALDQVRAQLLRPLTEMFFPASGTSQVKMSVLDPINTGLLQPLGKFLLDVEDVLARWEKDFTAPVQMALNERKQLRGQISEYKKQNGLG